MPRKVLDAALLHIFATRQSILVSLAYNHSCAECAVCDGLPTYPQNLLNSGYLTEEDCACGHAGALDRFTPEPYALFPVTWPFSAQDLLNSGYLTEVDSFSKMLHGVAALLPDLTQAVPYWVDDASVRESLQASAPSPDRSDAGCAAGSGQDRGPVTTDEDRAGREGEHSFGFVCLTGQQACAPAWIALTPGAKGLRSGFMLAMLGAHHRNTQFPTHKARSVAGRELI